MALNAPPPWIRQWLLAAPQHEWLSWKVRESKLYVIFVIRLIFPLPAIFHSFTLCATCVLQNVVGNKEMWNEAWKKVKYLKQGSRTWQNKYKWSKVKRINLGTPADIRYFPPDLCRGQKIGSKIHRILRQTEIKWYGIHLAKPHLTARCYAYITPNTQTVL